MAAVPSPTPPGFFKVVSYGEAFSASSSSSTGGGVEHSDFLDEATIREAIFGAAGCSRGAGTDGGDTVTHEEDCESEAAELDGTGSSVEAPPTSSVLGTTVSPCNTLPEMATVVEEEDAESFGEEDDMENSGEEDEEDDYDEGSGEKEEENMENSCDCEEDEDDDDESSGEEEDSETSEEEEDDDDDYESSGEDDYDESSCEEDVDESSCEEDDTETSEEEEDDDESSGEEEDEDTEISGEEEEDSDGESSSEDCFEIPATRHSTDPGLEPTASDANGNGKPPAFPGGTYDDVDDDDSDDDIIPSTTMCTHNTDQATAIEVQLIKELLESFPHMYDYIEIDSGMEEEPFEPVRREYDGIHSSSDLDDIDYDEDDDNEGSGVGESSKPSELVGRVYDDVDSGSDVEESVSVPYAPNTEPRVSMVGKSPLSEFLFETAPKGMPRVLLTQLYGRAGRSYDEVDSDSDMEESGCDAEDESCCVEEDAIDCPEEEEDSGDDIDNGDEEEIDNVPGVCGLCGHTVQTSNRPVELGSISDYDCFDPETVVRPAKVICKNGKAICIVYDDDDKQGVDNPMPEATGPSGGAEEHVEPVRRSYDNIDTDTEDDGGHNAVEEAPGASDTGDAKNPTRGPAGKEVALEDLRRRAVAEDTLEVEDLLLELLEDLESARLAPPAHAQERAGQRGAGSPTADLTFCVMVYVAAYIAIVCFSSLR
ncbi:hypothetical protein SETIT_9G070900v2 [Setaria italica]|uniref:Uncharacterized protein n=1 Tax=Setaria italica TaxID=4555 RepID=A0A368SDX3_SETIT|nr:hypothetical protein SETIT_9G070900v2 [Setaria italica]